MKAQDMAPVAWPAIWASCLFCDGVSVKFIRDWGERV